jgi:hypothetical protein
MLRLLGFYPFRKRCAVTAGTEAVGNRQGSLSIPVWLFPVAVTFTV